MWERKCWKSQKEKCVALSTAETKYIALSATVQEAIWIINLLTDFGYPQKHSSTISEDNTAAIAMSRNFEYHGRAKYIFILSTIFSSNILKPVI